MKNFLGVVALIFSIIGVVSMFNDRWGAGFLFLALTIGTICLIPQDGWRHAGSVHVFRKK